MSHILRPIYSKVCKTRAEYERGLKLAAALPEDIYPRELLVMPWKEKRTDQQNRYLWGVVYATISQATGQEPDDWHEYFLGEFFGWEKQPMFGRVRLKPRERSSKQIKERFSEYIEFIISRAAKFGINVPPPDRDRTW